MLKMISVQFRFLICFCVVVFVGCKKADFSEIDPNLTGGQWYSANSRQAQVRFHSDSYMKYSNTYDASSVEDDVQSDGTSYFKKGVIRLRSHKFKIVEYPVSFDTIINNDGQILHTHWRMKLKRDGSPHALKIDWDKKQSETYYRE